MRTTLDLPDPLFRELKARSTLRSVLLKDFVAEMKPVRRTAEGGVGGGSADDVFGTAMAMAMQRQRVRKVMSEGRLRFMECLPAWLLSLFVSWVFWRPLHRARNSGPCA